MRVETTDIAAVNRYTARPVGELCDGLRVQPLS